MANEEQLAILKQDVGVWNKWREENPDTVVDLIEVHLIEVHLNGVNLKGADLSRAELWGADLSFADLREANLSEAYLIGADLRNANLSEADLSRAKVRTADLRNANLSGADLRKAYLSGADLREAHLSGANLLEGSLAFADLRKADLSEANLSGTDLREADLSGANLQGSNFSSISVGETIFGDLDLRQVIGLDNIEHQSPSTIATNTFTKSAGKIPEVFLRGCGLSDWEIEHVKLYNPDLSNDEINQILYRMYELRATQALQISPLFISYSHADSEFVDKAGDYLTQEGIRYWRDIHKATAGPLEEQVNRAIRQNPTVLVTLSEHSIKSDWVQHEVRKARETGKELGRHVLCPVALDDSWKNSHWPERVMEQLMEYNILDFSEWRDDNKSDGMFRRLIDGLELFYKG